jgi:hypothetical protein
MGTALIDNLAYDSKEMRLYLEEKLILEVTELIAELMEKGSIRKAALAEKLQRSKGYITQLLDGRANMTLRTVADVMWALDADLILNAYPRGPESGTIKGEEYVLSHEMSAWPSPTIRLSSTHDKRKASIVISQWLKKVG